MPQSACFHCGETIPPGTDITLKRENENRAFCCHACLAVSQTIEGCQLGDYYKKRDTTPDRPKKMDFSVWDHPDSIKKWVKLDRHLASASLYIEGMHCTACAWLIEKFLGKNSHIHSASVNYEQSRLDVIWDIKKLPLSDLMQAVADIGYTPYPFQADIIRERQLAENRTLLKRIGITGILMMQIGMFSIGLYAGDYLGISDEHRQLLRVSSLIFSLPLLYYAALPFFTGAFHSLRNGQVSINLSISLAITGLYSSSTYSVMTGSGDIYFDSAAMFCLFVMTARYIERKSRSDMQPAQPVLPAFVTRIEADGSQHRISLDDIQPGDSVMVAEGDVIPLDGSVIDGTSSVSEALINGESAPVKKQSDSTVYAGSQNHDGQLLICVTHLPEQSLLHRINRLSQQASDEKPLFISITDRIAPKFTLIVFTLTALTYFYWLGSEPERAFWVALSVLVVSCPCALSLAAPTALSSVHYRLRKLGIFIRTPRVLETLNRVNYAVFDKTGTLTQGRYTLGNSHCENDQLEENIALAAALEQNSRHPLARAFLAENPAKNYPTHSVSIVPNQGIEGIIEQHTYRIGSPAFCRQWHAHITPPDAQQQWIGLCSHDAFLAWFSVHDGLRPQAVDLVQWLGRQGICSEILSGDSSAEVDNIAAALGIDQFAKTLSSEEKLQRLQEHQRKGHITLMVGDGINDAPVLAQSDIAVTLLHATDYVKNNADMVLLNDDLSGVIQAINSARRYRRILIQNFLWAFSYNILAIPFAMAGFITPWMAALGMSLSSVIVVMNSRRLARVKHKQGKSRQPDITQTPAILAAGK